MKTLMVEGTCTHNHNPMRPPWRVLLAALGPLVVVAAAALGGAASAAGERADSRYPNSIVVLGHSGATGYDSDPRRPRTDVWANSWATGTNPAVKSVYLRILAASPAIRGHNVNLAEDGANVRMLVAQAGKAVALKPEPELVLIQIMDNDIVCPATSRDFAAFRTAFASALAVIARGAPRARMFVVSQFGSPGTYAKALTLDQRRSSGGTGPCAFLDPSGRVVPKELARLEQIIHGYESQLAAGCRRFVNCRYDGGAFGRVVDQPQFISRDLNHFSIRGHAKAAGVAWSALKSVGIIPRSG